MAHRSPPCKFFSSFFYKCNLQGATDFAELGKRSWRHGAEWWSGMPHVLRRGTSQPTMQIFKRIFGKCNLRSAIDFAELRKRSSGANGWAGEYTDGRILSSPNFFSANFSATAICLILRSCGCGVGGDSEAIRRKGFWVPTPHITSQPTCSFFCTCILQTAIDFAKVR